MARIDDYSLYWCPPDTKEIDGTPKEKHWTKVLRIVVWIVEGSILILFVWACSVLARG